MLGEHKFTLKESERRRSGGLGGRGGEEIRINQNGKSENICVLCYKCAVPLTGSVSWNASG